MVNPVDNIAQQAHQGSVTAIIQVLNEQLADSGVRIRAVFEDGMLQLLCEASHAEQLDQSILVHRIREILESISPRNIRRVNINSRIVREQQLLWLEEIRRDPANQLLWSQKIAITQPNLLGQIVTGWKSLQSQRHQIVLPKTLTDSPHPRHDRFRQGVLGGISLSLALLFIGGLAYHHWFATDRASPSSTDIPVVATPTNDSFAEAVALAEQASVEGQRAQTSAQWLELAAKWQKAAELMAAIPPADPRYQTAQDRAQQYAQNSQNTQSRAQLLRNP